jgi:diacylglycerol kinase (ATP)
VKRFFESFKYAWRGIRAVFAEERNMKIHGVATVLVVGLGFYCRLTAEEWTAILLCIGLVFVLEILNTAIEALVDLVQPGHDPLAGKVKDIAAGAVLVGTIVAVAIGVIVFWKHV